MRHARSLLGVGREGRRDGRGGFFTRSCPGCKALSLLFSYFLAQEERGTAKQGSRCPSVLPRPLPVFCADSHEGDLSSRDRESPEQRRGEERREVLFFVFFRGRRRGGCVPAREMTSEVFFGARPCMMEAPRREPAPEGGGRSWVGCLPTTNHAPPLCVERAAWKAWGVLWRP